MRLLLDEMWSPAIALELRKRGHDVVAAQEREQHARFGGVADETVFERSQEDGRTIVTDNIADYEPLISDAEKRAVAHHGVVFCSSRQFDRSDPRTTGRMVDALGALLDSDDAKTAPFNRRHWLRRTS